VAKVQLAASSSSTAKAGLMLRQNNEVTSPFIFAYVSNSKILVDYWNTATNQVVTVEGGVLSAATEARFLEIERKEGSVYVYESGDSLNFRQIAVVTLALTGSVNIGINTDISNGFVQGLFDSVLVQAQQFDPTKEDFTLQPGGRDIGLDGITVIAPPNVLKDTAKFHLSSVDDITKIYSTSYQTIGKSYKVTWSQKSSDVLIFNNDPFELNDLYIGFPIPSYIPEQEWNKLELLTLETNLPLLHGLGPSLDPIGSFIYAPTRMIYTPLIGGFTLESEAYYVLGKRSNFGYTQIINKFPWEKTSSNPIVGCAPRTATHPARPFTPEPQPTTAIHRW
jgi:hypothetical protein